MPNRVRWVYNTITPRAAVMVVEMEAAFDELMEQAAEAVEAYAKENAPWDDQSGAAREGLTAEYHRDGLKLIIVLYHTVDYGPWLEVRWNGKYAIIIPTIEAMSPVIMGALSHTYEVMP